MKRITTLLFLGFLCVFTTQIKAQNYAQNLTDHFTTLLEKDNLITDDVQWLITDENVSRTSDIQHVYFTQSKNDIEVYGTQSGIHILNGETISSNNKFIFKSTDKILGSSSPSINATQAVAAAANQLGYAITDAITVLEVEQGNSQKTILSNGGISLSNIPAKLVYYFTESNQLVLAWDISIQEISQQDWWSIRIDAVTGEILNKNNWMVSCSFEHDHSSHENLNYNINLFDIPNYIETSEEIGGCISCYEVLAMPIESPYYGGRSIESGIEDATASPFGWHDTDGIAGAEFTVTRGNNVNSYDDGDNQGYQPDGGADLDFTAYPFSEIYSDVTPYEDAAITNLFYWNNIIHDVMYTYGFDEAGGNFQENNYGNGGAGSDSVNAEAQDGSGSCNANFGTPSDGGNPTMQMYVCGDKDGDFDNLVIVHEYGHGISNRLTGGPNNTGCLGNSEQMGEGWSDYYGVMMTIEPGDTGTDSRGVGTYLFGEGPDADGIRPFPYSTDMGVNPQTYDYIKTAAVPHGVGSVWATMLWEVSWALIDEHGFDTDIYNFTGDTILDAGNVVAMAIVTEGMKLQPCGPGFVDGRDAILAADQAIYGGANECIIWDAFARRGLGFSADQGSSGSVSDGTESFDSPVPAINTEEEVCVGQGVQVFGGGTPIGGVYSGLGVTDNGDGLTYDFDPAIAGIGSHIIEYDVVSTCAIGVASDDIEVISDTPEIICQDVALELDENGEAILTLQDVVENVLPGDMTVDQTGTFAPIAISGTTVSLNDDDVSNALNIGFTFNFYEVDYTNFYISSNGFITFSNGNESGCCTGGLLPSVGGPSNFIAFAWQDLNPSAGGTISYETVGTSPDRKLIMEFDDVPYYNSSEGVTSQIHLFEGTNKIEIHSTEITNRGPMTQGLENATGTLGLATPGRNSQTWSATNDYVAFYYLPGNTTDNCGSPTTVTLSQELFTCNDIGATTVTITIDDGNGNTNTCTAEVTVTDPLLACLLSTENFELDKNIVLYPNPTNGQFALINNSSEQLVSATIIDVNGRIIQVKKLSDATSETMISLEGYTSGIYFVKIEGVSNTLVKRIIKE
ncbi:MAG: hypothetical protein ACI9SJ_001222 [Flavobacteriaceae bacterium]|jgi:hypothetical protein|uniref:M36 family metallopeptidase n=1 Tax=Candidatus Marifrigoribacter sp. Uisw_064 TaxID=3230970 RepID=UPI003AE3A6E2